MNPAILHIPFVQIALPIMITFIGGIWLNSKSMDTMNKRLDDMNQSINGRFNEMNRRFDSLDAFMRDHSERIAWLEERTSPLARR